MNNSPKSFAPVKPNPPDPGNDALDLAAAYAAAGLPVPLPPPLVKNEIPVEEVRPTLADLAGGPWADPEPEAALVALPETPDADPARSAWSDAVRKDNDLVDLCIFARQALPSAEVPCCCGRDFQCLRCRVEQALARYLPRGE